MQSASDALVHNDHQPAIGHIIHSQTDPEGLAKRAEHAGFRPPLRTGVSQTVLLYKKAHMPHETRLNLIFGWIL